MKDASALLTTPLPLWALAFLTAAGMLLMLLSFLMPRNRKGLLMAGIALIAGALLLWILFGLAVMYARAQAGEAAGGFSSSGGFGGGSSRGGGATGSW